uniref:EXPERA domain-containing protein n=1 Tax=Bionectria ochroleuca TaxID=29856 RepID=A0A0B7K058_BIOOC
MTLSKSVLYWANEYYSGFDNIGHNSTRDLITLWVMPNVPWIILSAYMTYVMGSDIVDGLAGTAEHDKDE